MNSSPTFNVELQALAIRTGKIYLQETPSISENPVELFLDIEGIPDEGFHYLIGLLVRDNNDVVAHSFWADSLEDESAIFQNCLEIARRYPDAPIYHYGSYEPRALRHAEKKHGLNVSSLDRRLVNVNSLVFAKVYFPSWSNRLKELGGLVGATWPHEDASGLQSLVWRYGWEENRSHDLRQLLVDYNQELEKQLQKQSAQLKAANSRLEDEIREHMLDKGILKESERRYACFVENTLTGIYVIKGNRIVFHNQRFAEIFGHCGDDI